MAIISHGYPYSIQPGSTFAQVAQSFGKRYSVAGFDDFRVVAASSGTRRVNIAAGWAMGKGVAVQNTEATTLDLPAPSGSSQWFLVGLKRWVDNPIYDPGATPPAPEADLYISEPDYVAGTSSRTVPAVTQDAGDDDMQWLALCRVTDVDALVQEVVDLRLISGEGGGGYEVFSDLALGQLEDLVGARVYRGDTTGGHVPAFYERISSTSGTLSWHTPGIWQAYTPTFNTDNVVLRSARYCRDGDTVHVAVRVLITSIGSDFECTTPIPGRATGGWVDSLGTASARPGGHSGAFVYTGTVVAQGSGTLNSVTIVGAEPSSRWGPGEPFAWQQDGGSELGFRFSYEAA